MGLVAEPRCESRCDNPPAEFHETRSFFALGVLQVFRHPCLSPISESSLAERIGPTRDVSRSVRAQHVVGGHDDIRQLVHRFILDHHAELLRRQRHRRMRLTVVERALSQRHHEIQMFIDSAVRVRADEDGRLPLLNDSRAVDSKSRIEAIAI